MTFQTGDIILGKYRVESLIGEGAFGEVYRVRHLGLGVPRALKVLRKNTPGLGSKEFNQFLSRFQIEAQIGAQLNTPTPHPNLLQIHDNKVEGNLLVLEMEYAPGGSLADRLQRAKESGNNLPLDEVLQIALDIAEGLAAIHARDIVHRDLKPDNILFDDKGRAKVADLGLAQVPSGLSLRSKLSTDTLKDHPGTPGHMSPEQEKTRGILKPPSDVYAAGLLLFEMLTGRNYTFAKPGTRARSLRSDVPAWLDDLLAKMLAETPEERPWDGKEVAGLLREGIRKENKIQRSGQAEAEERARKAAWDKAQKKNAKQEQVEAQEQAEKTIQRTKSQLNDRNSNGLPSVIRYWPFVMGGAIILCITMVFGFKIISWPVANTPPDSKNATSTFIIVQTQTITPDQSAPSTTSPTILATNLPINTSTLVPLPTFTPTPFPTEIVDSKGVTMRLVPAGTFTMGSDSGSSDEQPVHEVYLDSFFIDKFEVTYNAYKLCWDADICHAPYHYSSYVEPSNRDYGEYPVTYVDFKLAQAYCTWRGAELPTEAQWEKAARGTDGRTYPWGEGIDCSHAIYAGCARGKIAVGSYEKGVSPYGLYDMAGNLWEWVADWYSETFYQISPFENPIWTSTGYYHVARGGSWQSKEDELRTANRKRFVTESSYDNVGFRCAKPAQ